MESAQQFCEHVAYDGWIRFSLGKFHDLALDIVNPGRLPCAVFFDRFRARFNRLFAKRLDCPVPSEDFRRKTSEFSRCRSVDNPWDRAAPAAP